MDTLLLNKDGAPVSVLPLSAVSWQDAVKYMCLDRVQVLEWYDDWIVRSAEWETKVPAVIMVKDYIKKRTYPRFTRNNLLVRDLYECQYCSTHIDRRTMTMDHVIPVCRGGETSWTNIVASCLDCNSRKGSKLIKPNNTPYKPTYYDLAEKRKIMPFEVKHPSWKDYLL